MTVTGEKKFKVGDMVYSYQNPNYKARVAFYDKRADGYPDAYKITLVDPEGYTRSSKWMSASSMTKRRTPKWLKENRIR